MKSELYDALAAINRGFDVTVESLRILKQEGLLTGDYVQQQTEILEEQRAALNCMVLNKLQFREVEDREHFGTMRLSTEAQLQSSDEQGKDYAHGHEATTTA